MATKKTAPIAEDENEVTQETQPETAQPEAEQPEKEPECVDPWKEQAPVYVPRARASEDQNAYVCVNDRRFSVPRNGKTQMLPRPIAEALQASIEAEYKAEEYAENIRVHEPGVGPIA